MKTCPYCAEEIKDEAVKCKHCGSFLDDKSSPGKNLYRTSQGAKILGICRGMAEYFDVDPVLMRVIAIVLIVLTGIIPGIIIYFALAFIIPKKEAISSNSHLPTPPDKSK